MKQLKAFFRYFHIIFKRKMASQNQEQENLDEENDSLLSSQEYETPSGTQVPILTQGPPDITEREDILVADIDLLIRRFLMRPNHQTPYSFTFRWAMTDGSDFSYSVKLTIHEPSQ